MTESNVIELRPDSDDFLSLLLNDTPFIDTRAPVEFAQGSFPNAVNLPLMTDEERTLVGTCYKEQGQDVAIKLGHRLVQGDIKAQRVQAWIDFTEQHPEGYLYCFRGGLRSKICKQWLADAGHPFPRITGGYKAMRRFLLDSIETISQQHKFMVLAGQTGAAKTKLLNTLATSVDLEGIARHRGSAFGKRVGGQPSQIDFENHLAIKLLKQRHQHPAQAILLEDESRLIGCRLIPDSLLASMQQAPIVLLNAPLDERVEHSFDNYILQKLPEWQAVEGDEPGFECFAQELRQSMKNIRKRLGGQRYEQYSRLLEQAIDLHREGDSSMHREWIRCLLEQYYDPIYNHHLAHKMDRVVFQGNAAEVTEYFQGK